MALTVLQARREISDMPRLCVAPGGYEMLTSQADGVAMQFSLRFTNANLGTLKLYSGTVNPAQAQPPTWTLVPPSDPTLGYTTQLDANNMPYVVFNTAPPRGTLLGVRYLVTAFSDADISWYLTAAQRSTDLYTLKAFHYEMIPVILGNREAMMIYRLTDRTDDPTAFINAQLKIRDSLAAQLQQEPGGVPAFGGSSYGGYGDSPMGRDPWSI